MIRQFWNHVAEQLAVQNNLGHPKDWEEDHIGNFLVRMENRLQKIFKADPEKAELCGIKRMDQIDKKINLAIDPSTFRKIFRYKSSNGQPSTRNKFAIYLNTESYQAYINNYELQLPVKKKKQAVPTNAPLPETQLTIKTFSAQLKKKYQTQSEFQYISILGGVRENQGRFPMSQFYIDLSYLDKDAISRQEALLLQEKESYQQKNIRRVLYQNALPHDFISDDILLDHSKLVVVGNPGAGKSTFARWLCWNWNEKQEANNRPIPIHINLRELRFGQGNCIVEYIGRKYFTGENISQNQIQHLIAYYPNHFLMLLDGLDEIRHELKGRLWEDLNTLSGDLKFIVFTRPYGLIDQHFAYDITFEIIGFNASTRRRYIELFLANINHQTANIDRLLQIITDNPILNDFSFNPLMLSYITLIYWNEKKPEEVLGSIESDYELQDRLLAWLKQYYGTKNYPQPFDELLINSRAFAYEMEKRQLFLYDSKETIDPYSSTTDILSQLGLGNKERTKTFRWRFHFNTITFQEFLAAGFIGNSITAEALLYLLNDEIQWNFARMLIGHLSINSKRHIIDNVLTGLQQLHKDSSSHHYKQLYLYLLGELKRNHLIDYAKDSFLEMILEDYIQTPTDSKWESLVLESIGRIFTKLPIPKQQKFGELILKKLDIVMQKVYFRDRESGYTTFTNRLITRLFLDKNEQFVSKFLIKVLGYVEEHQQTIQALEEINEVRFLRKEEDEYLKSKKIVQNNRIVGLMSMVNELEERFLLSQKNILKNILGLLSPNALERFVHLKVYCWDHKKLQENLEQTQKNILAKLRANDQLADSETGELPTDLAQEVIKWTVSFYVLAYSCQKTNNFPEDLINQNIHNLISFLNKHLDEENSFFSSAFEEMSVSAEYLIKGMSCLQPYVPLAKTLDVIYAFATSEEIKYRDQNYFQSIIEWYLSELDSQFDVTMLHRLISAFTNTQNGIQVLSIYLKDIFRLFEQLLKRENKSLNEAIHKLNKNYFIRRASQATAILEDLRSILEYEYDKKYFIDQVLKKGLEKNNYIAVDFLPHLLSERFAFYDKPYWEFINYLITEKKAIYKALFILSNPWPFQFKSNIYFISGIWENIANQLSLFEEENLIQYSVLFKSAFNTLRALMEFKLERELSAMPFNLLKVFQSEELKKKAMKGTSIFHETLVYPLLFHFTQSEKCLLPEPIQVILEKEYKDYDLIVPYIVEIFNKNEITALKSFWGNKLYRASLEYYNMHTPVKGNFSNKNI